MGNSTESQNPPIMLLRKATLEANQYILLQMSNAKTGPIGFTDALFLLDL
jgi:hypothetical protein